MKLVQLIYRYGKLISTFRDSGNDNLLTILKIIEIYFTYEYMFLQKAVLILSSRRNRNYRILQTFNVSVGVEYLGYLER
jgi:hypothetical protein